MKLELHTERLLLTPLALADLDISLELWTDPEVVEFVCDPVSKKETSEEMPDAIRRGGNGGIGIWCVADRQTREKYGSAYLLPMPVDNDEIDYSLLVMGQMPDAEIEVGYFLKRSAWGRGYATEVCRRMLQFAFKDISLDEVIASVGDNNVASKKVLQKSGLRGRGRAQSWGKDSPIYRITRDEWNELH